MINRVRNTDESHVVEGPEVSSALLSTGRGGKTYQE